MSTSNLTIAASELLIGGQRSGKSARAETITAAWLTQNDSNAAVMIATATAWDDEMQQRIARHQSDRAARVPRMRTIEEPLQLARCLHAHSQPNTLIVVDCMSLWLTNWMMPADQGSPDSKLLEEEIADCLTAIAQAQGPVVFVTNEIGLGVIPMGRDVREFVDALGRLNQLLAGACQRVTLMAAGLPLTLKAPL
ncbi:bifunctional adenosylcobinamide kinase/adenosylcobinamide-phosphate guanylyltransferase [Undibacterium sp. Di24W]|uniref:bifunctional adenosylcobinamide kinase/adenosylcobinamide-phosphate guanylyltransferase n=1 Tax=Undibacterium sp. Di24W TaxID=3413033 RepID=UPI003BEF8E71